MSVHIRSQSEVENKIEFDMHAQSVFNLKIPEQKLIKEWLGFPARFELLYRGSRDGFKGQAFHERCDEKGPTITLVKTEYDRICGGYTGISWTNPWNGGYRRDDDAFIFSLTHKTKHGVTDPENAVCHVSNYITWFGCNGNLYLDDDCDKKPGQAGSYNFGLTFQLP